MTTRLPFAAALPRVHGGVPAWGILSGACWARRDDPRYVGQQRLAERRQRRIQVRHLERRHQIVLLIRQSRPITVSSRKKGMGPRWDPSYFIVHEIRQWWRRGEGIPDPPADPPGAVPAGVTADVPAGISAAFASDLGWSGGNAIVVALL